MRANREGAAEAHRGLFGRCERRRHSPEPLCVSSDSLLPVSPGSRESSREHGVNIPIIHRRLGKCKSAMLPHLPGGAKKGAKSGAGQSAADTDASDSNRREFSQAQLNAL